MKFRKITFNNHPILRSVSFDFTDAQGRTVDTIIIAGENGCGKSLLLSFLNSYNPVTPAKQLGYTLRVEVEFSDDDIKLLNENKDFLNVLGQRFSGNIVTFVHDTTFRDDNPRAEFINKNGVKDSEYAFQFGLVRGVFKSVFSDVEINFSPNEVQHTTSSNLDSVITSSVRSSNRIATEIKQLLVDIYELDNGDLGKWVDAHRGQAPGDEIIHRRIHRFTNAFDKMFPHKHFVGVDNKDGKKIVLFEEFGKQMEISQLSSGEKQIVFRGGFLLRDLGSINGATVLIDEPELSLHPQWQLKILNFFKSLFTDENGKQTSQLIVATHSPFILHNDTRANDKVIVMRKDDKGNVMVLDRPEYYNWSEASTVEEAFNVTPLLTEKKVYVFLEGETDELYFNKAMEVFGIDDTNLSFNWIGHYSSGNKGKAENTGDTALNNAASFFRANPLMMNGKMVYLLYDCDTNKPYTQEGSLFIGAMTKNSKATVYMIGVENLLELPADFDYSVHYKSKKKTDDYGAVSEIVDLDKKALADHILNLPNARLESILKNVNVEIEKIIKNTGL